MLKTLKAELLMAAVSAASGKVVRMVRDATCHLLDKYDIVDCEGSPIRMGAITTALGVALPYVPYLNRYQLTQVAASQFRVQGMIEVADTLMDRVLPPKRRLVDKE
jgi:hypothetical protein